MIHSSQLDFSLLTVNKSIGTTTSKAIAGDIPRNVGLISYLFAMHWMVQTSETSCGSPACIVAI